jgi:hypothetical protein
MLHLKDTLSMFKEGDENKLLENFDKVMSQITETFKFDEDGQEDDDDEDLPTDMKEANAMLANLLKSANQASRANIPTSSTSTSKNSNTASPSSASPSKKASANTTQEGDKPASSTLNPTSFFNAEFLSKLNANSSSSRGNDETEDDNNDELSEMEASMMEPLLSMLFSKEILYPSLKMMLDNFDKYLEEKQATLSDEELSKCKTQQEYIAEMCRLYEENVEGDSEAETKKKKSQQLKRIIELLEKCGMPPSELGKNYILKRI